MKKLTNKQEMFCREYIIDWNGKRAAIRAGYAPNNAEVIASKLLRNVKVATFLDKLKKNIEKTLEVSAFRNVQELMKIAYSNASDLRISFQELKDFADLPDDIKATIETIEYQKTTFGENGIKEVFKIKQYSKIKAIEIINNMLGYNSTVKKSIDIKNRQPIFKMVDVSKPINENQ